MRILTIISETDLQGLRRMLIDRRLGAARADAAIERIRALNPHVDLDRAGPGTVIFLPDAPGIRPHSGDSPAQGAAEAFQAMAAAALDRAAGQLKAGLAERASEREAVRAALDSPVFRRSIGGDQALRQRAEEAAKAIDQEEEADRTAAETLDATGKAALEALLALGKLAS